MSGTKSSGTIRTTEKLFEEWAARGFSGLKKGKGIQEKNHLNAFCLGQWQAAPCSMIFFCTSGWWKNQIGHTASLLTFLDVCSNTHPAPSLSAGKRGEKKTTSEECYQRYLTGNRSQAEGSGGGEASLSWQGMISREKQRFSFYNISHFGSMNQAQDWHYLITRGLCLAAFFGWVFVTLMYFYSFLLSLPLHLPKNLAPNPLSNHLIQCIVVW